jgi:gamma-glutamyltranspeptidase/glutathione hydrolase
MGGREPIAIKMSTNILAGRYAWLQSKRALWVVVALVAYALVWVGAVARAAYPAPLHVPVGHGVVAADNVLASKAGAEVLGRGGNAVDAAVATALALGVVSPAGSGLGGGGFLVYWSAREQKAYVLDFRETAPAAASRDMYLVGGKADSKKSQLGGLSVATPGEPAGLAEAETKLGKLGLAAAAEPAIRLARDGFAVSAHLAEATRVLLERKLVTAPDPLLAMVAPDGTAIVQGQRIRRPALAHTLETFARSGAPGFYRGEVARALVQATRSHGGILTEADLAAYKPNWRDPLIGHFRGRTLYGAPPPAGGLTAIQTLQILDARPPLAPLGAGSSATYQELAEAFKHAFADRARLLGDPAFVDVPTGRLLDPAYARELAARIDPWHVRKPDEYGDQKLKKAIDVPHDHGTSHLCVADADGNVAALTTTINLHFGSKVLDPKTGVILNDEMDDFSAQPGVPNAYGLIGAEANAIAPGKRPLSSMTPLIVLLGGKPEICAGGSGGPMIVSETVQTVVNAIDFGLDAEAAVSSPRIHAQWVPDVLFVEPEVPADVVENLRKRGQHVLPPPGPGAAQALVWKSGTIQAASDPRKGGSPAAP